jgi:hypothetical protein
MATGKPVAIVGLRPVADPRARARRGRVAELIDYRVGYDDYLAGAGAELAAA